VTYVSLYRRFRPQTFTEVVGQDHVTRTLRNAIAAGRTSHAYLFCGPRGTGKTTVAKVLAKALNCKEGPTPDPCGRCEACIRIRDGRSMDVIEIDAASNRGIDEIRDLRERVKFAPVEERYKVYIIDEVHMLTQEAFNALLKTLEEPPQRVVFILATTEPQRVLPTILSRCQRFDFRRLTISELSGQVSRVAEVEGIELSKDAIRLIATGAQGAARDALGLLEQCAAYTGGEVTYDHAVAALGVAGFRKVVEFSDAVIQGDLAAALTLVRELIDSGHDPALFLRDVLEHFRNLLVLATCGFDPNLIDVPEAALDSLKRQAEFLPGTLILQAIDILSGADAEMKYSASPQLTAEVIAIKLVYLHSSQARESQTVESQTADSKAPDKQRPDRKGAKSPAAEDLLARSVRRESPSDQDPSAKRQPADAIRGESPPVISSQSPSSAAPVPRTASPGTGAQLAASPGTGSPPETRPPAETRAARSKSTGDQAGGVSVQTPVTPVRPSLDEIIAGWNHVIDELRPGIWKTLYCDDGIPVELNENELVIAFHDDVRKELASERRRKKSIQDALEKVFRVKLAVSFILTDEPHRVQFHIEPGEGLFNEKEPSKASLSKDMEYAEEITGDIKDEGFQGSEPGGVSGDNGSFSEIHEEEVEESLRKTRDAVREHPTVKAALSVFKGRVFKIDV
jgi:DNA polymerase-3 subunit gamma/tau